MAKFCIYCGTKMNDGAKFCPSCGKPVKSAAENTAAAPDESAKPQPAPENTAEPAPKPAPQKALAPKPAPQKPAGGTNTGVKIANVFLALILLIEFAVAGFKYPGFFVKRPKDDGGSSVSVTDDAKNNNGTEIDGEENEGEAEYEEPEITPENCPGDPSLINIRITESEVMAAEPVKAEVSPDDPVCEAGDISVDFGSWNLDGADTFNMRSLGERSDEENGITLNVYDFSLESGQNTFLTNVDITIPRPQDGSGEGVLYYNPETDEWESTSYSISEDGENYILHTSHFCGFGIASSKGKSWDGIGFDTMGVFYTKASPETAKDTYALMQEPVYISDEAITKMLEKLITTDELSKVIDEKSYVRKEKTMGYTADKLLGEGMSNYFDQINDTYSASDPAINIINAASKGGANSLSNTLTYAAPAILAFKMSWAASRGESNSNIIKEYSVDTICAGIGLVLATGGASLPVAAVASVTLALTSYFGGDSIKAWISDQLDDSSDVDPNMSAYTYYCLNGGVHYLDANGNKQPLKLDGGGWEDYLKLKLKDVPVKDRPKVIEKIYDGYVETYWASNRDAYIDDYNRVLRNRYLAINGTAVYANEKIPEVYAKYLGDLDAKKIEEYKINVKKRLFRNTKTYIDDINKTAREELAKEIKDYLRKNVLPSMNTDVEIVIKDTALKDGETFDKSAYASGILKRAKEMNTKPQNNAADDILSMDPNTGYENGVAGGTAALDNDSSQVYSSVDSLVKNMLRVGVFDNVKTEVKMPPGYKITSFDPRPEENSDTVLKCKMYYYVRFGMPSTMSLFGDSATGAQEQKNLPIKFKKQNNIIVGTVTLDGVKQEEKKKTTEVVYKCSNDYDPENAVSVNEVSAVNAALGQTKLTVEENGNFSASGTASFKSKNKGSYSGDVTLSGNIDPKTGEGTCTISGSVNNTDSSNDSWTDEFSWGNISHNFHYSCSLHYRISGNGTVRANIENGVIQSFNCIFPKLDIHESGSITSVDNYTGPSGSNKDDKSGSVDEDLNYDYQYNYNVHYFKES